MNLDTFIANRAGSWESLQQLLDRAARRRARLDAAAVLELGSLYRATVADLAWARRRFPGDPLLQRLETLVLRGRQVVYGERVRRGSLWSFFAHGYWRELRARPATLALAVVALLGPAVLACAWAAHDPGAAIGLLPSAFRGAADPQLRHLPSGAASQAAAASSIYTNNITVTFLAFAGGMLLGLGTLAVLAYNGLLLGALAGLTLQAGTFSVFVSYVAPHGLLELSCIAVAGSAGLRLGSAIVTAGPVSRGEALRRAARPAVMLVLGTAPWLVVAGLVEGFVTPRGLPAGEALAIGVALACLFWGLCAGLGRAPSDAVADRGAAPSGFDAGVASSLADVAARAS